MFLMREVGRQRREIEILKLGLIILIVIDDNCMWSEAFYYNK